MESLISVCFSCGVTVFPTDKFCPNCGIALATEQSFSLSKQVWIYFVSIFLPPFGFIWTVKYIRSPNQKLKKIAVISTILTVVSIIINIWFLGSILFGVQQQMSQIQSLGL